MPDVCYGLSLATLIDIAQRHVRPDFRPDPIAARDTATKYPATFLAIVEAAKVHAPDEVTFTLADLDREEVGQVLGLMNFHTCPVAHAFRAAGEVIPHKVEAEQAYVLRWLLKLALEHGPRWSFVGDAQIQELKAKLSEAVDG